jgi:hypothetical protein
LKAVRLFVGEEKKQHEVKRQEAVRIPLSASRLQPVPLALPPRQILHYSSVLPPPAPLDVLPPLSQRLCFSFLLCRCHPRLSANPSAPVISGVRQRGPSQTVFDSTTQFIQGMLLLKYRAHLTKEMMEDFGLLLPLLNPLDWNTSPTVKKHLDI